MRTLLQDIRYGVRMLWKARGFTFVAALSLALGIGANTTIFSMVNGLLVRPLPYRDAERLVIIAETKPKQGIEESSLSFPNVTDYKNQSRSFASIAPFNRRHFNLAGENEPERVQGLSASANLFATLGVSPAIGRDFSLEEDRPGAPPVVIISDNLWRYRFDSDRDVIGKTLRLNGENHTIVGVMPAAFKFPEWAEVWTPLAESVDETERGSHYLNCIARLKPDVSIEAAEAELSSIARNLERQYPETNAGRGVMLQPLREDLVGNELRVVLALLLGAVGFVLLIACANIANLLLA
ncbi:MAG: ABC transporter permease, partial [Acidobacteria bacterium]|nr:ABC transporter permease [Acidobacteriota bacterium]